MAATASQVLSGIKTRLATISGLRAFSYQPAQVNPPTAFPRLDVVRYHGAMGGGMVEFQLTVIVIVGRYDDSRAHTDLDEYIAFTGAKRLRAVIESDQTLGGVTQNVVVASTTNISSLSVADAEFLQLATQVTVNG